MPWNPLQIMLANAQAAQGQYAAGMPELGMVVGGPETQAVDGQLARNVAPSVAAAQRIPGAPVGPVPVPTPAPRVPVPTAAPRAADPMAAAPEVAEAAAPAPRAPVSQEPETASAMGYENLLAGKDLGSLLRDFMAGAASSQGGGIEGIATGYLGAAGNRDDRETRKRNELAAVEAARIKAEDRLYDRGRDSASDSRADKRLAFDMTKEEKAAARETARAERESRRDSLADRRTTAEIAKMDREGKGEKPLTRAETERLTMDFRKSITPDRYVDTEERAEIDKQVADYKRGLGEGSGAGPAFSAEPSSGSSAEKVTGDKEGDVKQQGDGFVTLKNGKWIPFQ